MKNLIPVFLLSLTCLAGLISCATLDPENSFLVTNLDSAAKSRALVEAGLSEYKNKVLAREEYQNLPHVRDYFLMALRLDPANAAAKRALAELDDYRTSHFQENISSARNLIKKTNRKDSEDIALAVAIQRAVRLDANNDEAKRLLADTESLRVNLVKTFLSRARSSTDKISDKTPEATQDGLYIEAWQNVSRALTVAPENTDAQGLNSTLTNRLNEIIKQRLDNLPSKLEAGKFTAVKAQIDTIVELNDKLGGAFQNQVRNANYLLYFRWASNLFNNKDYVSAEARLNTAITFQKNPEALNLLDKINALQDASDEKVSFETNLANLDRQINAGELTAAQRTLTGLTRNTHEKARADQLVERRKRLSTAIADLYAKGVAAYRNENFAVAIEALQMVNNVSPGYEQANDFLEKAKTKKKLLDQY